MMSKCFRSSQRTDGVLYPWVTRCWWLRPKPPEGRDQGCSSSLWSPSKNDYS